MTRKAFGDDWRAERYCTFAPYQTWLDLIGPAVEWDHTEDADRLLALLDEIQWLLAFETIH